ncbi:Rho GTPase-activating protein 8 [Smittium mucronatum]|uniref:Rho GTPase-activating protein 8 n=1 Tax=Smittium mucronatum TaxID=133383 RepID=A0A1R0H201_9FUNG|nr:Rho GTPase-activating protein 8 [Smittium mucronatum]
MTVSTKSKIMEEARSRGFPIEIADGDFGDNVKKGLLYCAGLDSETLPIIVFSDDCLPDPKTVNYDSLLANIKKKTAAVVNNDYVVVYFASPNLHKPSWQWIISAYYSLDRKYKKNLKKFYIVYPSTWTKLLLNTFAPIISSKFYSKLVYVDSIEQLKSLVPLSKMDVLQPAENKNLDHQHKPAAAFTPSFSEAKALCDQIPIEQRLFGSNTSNILSKNLSSGIYTLPIPLINWLLQLHSTGTYTQGVFQHLPSEVNITDAKLKTQLLYAKDHNSPEFLAIPNDVNIAACLLKLFFYELNSPIFSHELVEVFTQLPLPNSMAELSDVSVSLHLEKKRIAFVKSKVLPLLPSCDRQLLAHLFCLLSDIAQNSEQNNMSSFNLAKIWGPILIGKYDDGPVPYFDTVTVSPSLPSAGSVVQIMIQYFYLIFGSEINTILKVKHIHCETLVHNMVLALEQQLNIFRE